MSQHRATVAWHAGNGNFRDGSYSRAHTWAFDGGLTVPASPSPQVVRPPQSDPSAVDPEEAFVAAISSCHLLTFLYLAQRRGLEVESYVDEAVGVMTKNERRVPWVSRVELRPRVTFVGQPPDDELLAELHHQAHELCFISNSVKTEIVVCTP
ncbi:MAG: OsmC family protein [Polyangiaceae bacterium]